MDLFDLFAKISLDTSAFDSGLDSASKRFQDVGKTLSDAGGVLTKAVTVPVAGLGAAIIKTGADYEAGMSKVQAISGATAEDMAMLGDEAMRMAAQTKFSTAESAEAYQYMAMAGWDAEQMVDGLSGIMLLASASGESLASTSDIVTDALTAFGLKAGDSGRFANVLAAASNSANTNVSMLGESFKYVAPVAGAMGYSVEDTSIALGLMANSGIKASQAGTALRTTLTNMANPTDSMDAAMKRLGLSLIDDEGNMKSLMEIMQDLRNGFGGGRMATDEFRTAMDELNASRESGEIKEKEYQARLNELITAMYGAEGAEKAQLAAMLAGKEGMSGLLAIVSAAPEDFNKLTDSIYNSSGTTQEMADIMNDNASGAMAMLSSAINVLFTNLSQFLIPAFTEIVRKATEVVNWFNSLDEGTQKMILTIAGIAAAVGPVLVVVGNVISAIGKIGNGISSLIGVVGKAGSAISGLFSILAANPIALVIAAVAALVAGLVVLWNTNEGFRDAVGAIWEAITGFFTAAWETIKGAWEGAGAFFTGIWEGISGAFSAVVEFFGGIFSDAWAAITAVWDTVVAYYSAIWGGIQEIFAVVVEVLGGFFTAAWEAIQTAWDVAVEFFSNIWNGIQEAFSVAAEVLGGFFSAAWDAITAVWDFAVEFFSGVWDGISGAFGAAAEWFGGVFSDAWSAVTSAWDGVTAFFSEVWDDITGVFSNVWEKFSQIGKNIVDGIKDGIKGAWDAFTKWLNGLVGGIVDGVKAMLGIHSPSTVFAGIGENMALGLAEGWEDRYRGVKRVIEEGLSFDPNNNTPKPVWPNWPSGGGNPSSSRGGDTYNFYSPKALDPVSAAREMKKAKQQMALGYV